jgi:transposase-like protein
MGVGEPYELADVRQAIAANALTGDYSVSGLARRMADH